MTDLDQADTPETGPFGISKAAPDGLVASILLSFLTTAGLFYVNILAALVSGLVDGLGFTKATAGYVASANVYGAAAGALIVVFLIKRLSWRPVAILALFGLIGLDLFSMTITSSDVMIPLRFVHGLTGGFLVGIGFSVIARTGVPDRVFGMLLVVQFGLGGVGLMFLPGLVPVFGAQVLFMALIAFSVVTLLMLPFLSAYPRGDNSGTDVQGPAPAKILIGPLAVAMLAVFAFQAANMGLAAYMIELGRSRGLATGDISNILGIANWVAIAGAALVYVIAVKYGRAMPLAIGMVLTLAGLGISLLQCAGHFLRRQYRYRHHLAFIIPYLLGLCAAFDTSGQTAALGGFISKLGLASGPLIAAIVIGEGNYQLIINLALAGVLISLLAALGPARLLDRKIFSDIKGTAKP